MDTSKEYILMCEKAREIQDGKPDFEVNDCNYIANFHHVRVCPDYEQRLSNNHVWTKYLDEKYCSVCGKELVPNDSIPEINDYEENGAFKCIWLPRQDQLQEMVWEYIVDNDPLRGECVKSQKPELLSNRFNKYVMRSIRPRFDSMEQLWLAFVMKEKFGKIWNGKDWEVNR